MTPSGRKKSVLLCRASVFAFLLLSLVSSQAHAFTVPTLAAPIVDEAGILSQGTEVRLSGELRRLRESGGSQISVLTVRSLDGMEIEEASIKVAEAWKLGSASQDDGVLLMIAPFERKLRIEVGYGKEGDLPDAIARRIIDVVIKPAFRQRQFDVGVTEGLMAIIGYTDPKFVFQGVTASGKAVSLKPKSSWFFGLIVVGMIFFWLWPFILLWIVYKILQKLGLKPEKYLLMSKGGRTRSGFGGSSGGWSSSGGFRSGGWSGGGGGFGGGGASGSW